MGKTSKNQKSIFAQNIVLRRKALAWTQMDLADNSNLALNTIKSIERGKSNGWPDTKEAIAKALNCSVGDLFRDPKIEESYLQEELTPRILTEIKELRKELKNNEGGELNPEVLGIINTVRLFNKKQLAELKFTVSRIASGGGLADALTDPKNLKKR